MKILSIVGARPQFIKAAAVSRVLGQVDGMDELLVHTGQHYDNNMSDVFFGELDIPEPAYNLGIGSGSHGQQTGKMLERLEEVVLRERPDRVLVYGDTNSTLAGALAAAKLHVPVAHVEAGLRSFNRHMPEEINRVLTDHVADVLFAPTDQAVINLRQEGIPDERVHLVGDVMYDAALYYADKGPDPARTLARHDVSAGAYILCTIHRAENTDDPARLRAILHGLSELAKEIDVVLPVHPRTRKAISEAGLEHAINGARGLRLSEPVGYLDMIALEKHAQVIATDSGGIQKEAYFYRVPCVTLRDETEWVELVEHRWNRLAPPVNPEAVAQTIRDAIGTIGDPVELYGGGQASERIAVSLRS